MSAVAQEFKPNYDESKVGAYVLPEPLAFDDGKPVTTIEQWNAQRAPEILQLFKDHVYGEYPAGPQSTRFEVLEEKANAVNGKATARQIRIFFGATEEFMDMILYVPNNSEKPSPVFIGLNFKGNQSISSDRWIPVTARWIDNDPEIGITDHKANESTRGVQETRWPLEMIIDAGYGIATAYYGDLEPDHQEGWKTGIRNTLKNQTGVEPDQWSAIGAWGWGLSRMMDYLETDRSVDAQKVVITGHSRLGKAALWAAANDKRFAIVVSNDSGEGGAALSRRNYGETVESINRIFPHWFVGKFKSYGVDPSLLPVDQHMLLALMAPRPLYVASAQDDQWADPQGEFLSAVHAGSVYELFRKKGLGTDKMPATGKPVGSVIGYHIRTGEHDIKPYDWEQYISFANRHFR